MSEYPAKLAAKEHGLAEEGQEACEWGMDALWVKRSIQVIAWIGVALTVIGIALHLLYHR